MTEKPSVHLANPGIFYFIFIKSECVYWSLTEFLIFFCCGNTHFIFVPVSLLQIRMSYTFWADSEDWRSARLNQGYIDCNLADKCSQFADKCRTTEHILMELSLSDGVNGFKKTVSSPLLVLVLTAKPWIKNELVYTLFPDRPLVEEQIMTFRLCYSWLKGIRCTLWSHTNWIGIRSNWFSSISGREVFGVESMLQFTHNPHPSLT